MNLIEDLDERKERWFEMEKGGRVQFRTVSPSAFREIQRKTVKKKVDFKKVDGTPARLEYEDINIELQNELYWDAAIGSWDEFSFRHPVTKEIINCTPETCTKENKVLLMNNSKAFASFAAESIKTLADETIRETETIEKNL